MKISELSNLTKIPIRTLRYYETIGLLKPVRLANNYRDYQEADINWIAFIVRAKATGMTLANIKTYSDLREKGDETIPQRIKLLKAQADILQEKKQELQGHIDFLDDKLQNYERALKA